MTEIISPDNQLVDDGGISTQRTQIWLDQVTDLQIITGTGTPEGIVSANVSRLYLQTDGTDGAVLFIKQLSDIGGDPKYGWVVCGGGGSASIALEDLTDVTITSIATGELLKWNGSAWVNNTLSEAGVQPEEDQRLSTTDSVEFLSVTTGNVIATGNITVTGTVDGRDIAVDGIKLDGIEAGADVTDTDNVVASLTAGANITIAADGTISATSSGGNETLAQTLVLGNTTGGTDISVSTGDNIVVATGSTVDGRDISVDGTKLDGIEASADVTDTANVTAAGALMASEVVNLDQVKNFDSADYATAAQGVTADNALPLSGGTMTGVIASFESTGIDDNATSTQLTITDSTSTFAGDVSIGGILLDNSADKVFVGDGTNSSTALVLNSTATGSPFVQWEQNGVFKAYMQWSNSDTAFTSYSTSDILFKSGGFTALTLDSSQDATFEGDVTLSAGEFSLTTAGSSLADFTRTGRETFQIQQGSGILGFTTGTALKVNGTEGLLINATDIAITSDGGSTRTLRLESDNTATFAGNVLLGDGTDISPSATATGQLRIQGNAYRGYTALDATGMYIGHNSSARALTLQTNETDALQIDGSQNATFAGSIDASAGGIYLGGAAAANHLDDYEEGTWTPTNYTGGGAYNAKYIKIGNLVTVSVYLAGGSFGSNTLGGLPYSPSTSNRYVAGTVGYTDTTNVTACYTQTSSRLFFVNKTSYVTPNNDRMMIQVSYFVGI